MCIDKLIKNDYMIAVCGKEDKDLKREFQPKQKSQDGTMSVWGTDGKEQAQNVVESVHYYTVGTVGFKIKFQ